jgi:hypothetical protein
VLIDNIPPQLRSLKIIYKDGAVDSSNLGPVPQAGVSINQKGFTETPVAIQSDI